MTDHYHVLLDCKNTYKNKFIKFVTPCAVTIIDELYYKAQLKIDKTKQSQLILKYFQDNLKLVKDWDNHTLTKEISKICVVNNMDWLDELIRAIFIASYKIINVIHDTDTEVTSDTNIDINIDIPNTKLFIHTMYINISRELWKNPYLKYHGYKNNNIRQKQYVNIETLIKQTIEDTIEQFLPIHKTLQTLTSQLQKNNNKKKKKSKTARKGRKRKRKRKK